MTDAPRKRPWFQYHLSTAIVLVFAAALVVFLNVTPRQIPWMQEGIPCYGWPFGAYYPQEVWFSENIHKFWLVGHGIVWWATVADFAAAVAVLSAMAFACEWLIRRQERRP